MKFINHFFFIQYSILNVSKVYISSAEKIYFPHHTHFHIFFLYFHWYMNHPIYLISER